MHVGFKLLPADGMAYVAMSRQSYVAMPLSEAQLATMSPSQVRPELKVLEGIKQKLLKAQGIHKVEEEQEDEEHKLLKRQAQLLKRQAKLLKRQAKRLRDLETQFKEAKRISKPGESDSSKSIWSPGEIAQKPGPGEGNEWLFEEAKPCEVDMLLAKARSCSLKRQCEDTLGG